MRDHKNLLIYPGTLDPCLLNFLTCLSNQTITSVDTWVICLLPARSSLVGFSESLTTIPYSGTRNNFVACVCSNKTGWRTLGTYMNYNLLAALWYLSKNQDKHKVLDIIAKMENSLQLLPKPTLQGRVNAILCVLYRNKFTTGTKGELVRVWRLGYKCQPPLNYRITHLQSILWAFSQNQFPLLQRKQMKGYISSVRQMFIFCI